MVNLLTDHDLSAGVGGWGSAQATLTVPTDSAGVPYLHIVSTGTGNRNTTLTPSIACNPGDVFSGQFQVARLGGGAGVSTMALMLQFLDASNVQVSVFTVGGVLPMPFWQNVTDLNATCPAGAVKIRWQTRIEAAATGDVLDTRFAYLNAGPTLDDQTVGASWRYDSAMGAMLGYGRE